MQAFARFAVHDGDEDVQRQREQEAARRPRPFFGNVAAKRNWKAAIERAEVFSRPSCSLENDAFAALSRPACYEPLLASGHPTPEAGLAAYAAPYLRRAAREFYSAAVQAEEAGIEGVAIATKEVFYALRSRLLQLSSYTSALLLNVARLKGELIGSTPEERKNAFCKMLLEVPYRRACRDRFPIVDEILQAVTDDAIDSFKEFIGRLCSDQNAIAEILPGGLGRIERLEYYAGDPHNRGRCVVVVHGTGGSIVYKPRSLDTDIVMARALAWLDEELGIGLRQPAVVQRDGYGWTEFVTPTDCESMDEVRLCYERMGATIAMIFILGGSDVHHGNIICSGAIPYVIDVEALLNGPLNTPEAAIRWKQRARLESICNTCYLPARMIIGDSVVDVTGAGYRPGQSVDLGTQVNHSDGDEIFAKPMYSSCLNYPNAPTLNGARQEAQIHEGAIERGIRAAMNALLKNRDEFLNRDDLMPSFATATSRFVPRATSWYARTLSDSLHPHACRDRETHDRVLSALKWQAPWLRAAAVEIIANEIVDLRRGDIPFFKSAANSRSIFTAAGHEIQHVFQESGYDSAVKRVRRLTRREIESQVAAVRLAFSASRYSPGEPRPSRTAPAANIAASTSMRIAIAEKIADSLIRRAICTSGGVQWLGRTLVKEEMSVALSGPELYGGVAGIGIFFAELAKRTGKSRYRRTALQCLRTMRGEASSLGHQPSAFGGLTGLIYADLIISRGLGRAPWSKSSTLVELVIDGIERDTVFDVIGGAAGALLVAVRLLDDTELAPRARLLADACKRHLLDNAQSRGAGLGWKSDAFDVPLTGLAHGSCGIGLALAEYGAAFGDEDAWEAAYGAFSYAKPFFDESVGLWRDLRHEKGHAVAWCHGAAGMALARQRAVELDPRRAAADGQILHDIDRGLAAITQGYASPAADTICHGRSGNWEALWRGAEEHRAFAEGEVDALCADWERGIMPAGDLSESTPDLMNGLAGIGLQLLRSIDRTVACVATLQL